MISKFSQLQFSSTLAGLENYKNDSFNFSVDGHNLTAGQSSRWSSSWPINNVNAISSVELQYTLDNVWRYISGALELFYNSNQYEVLTLTYYSNSNLIIETYVINQTGGTITIPQFFVNIRVALFNAPF